MRVNIEALDKQREFLAKEVKILREMKDAWAVRKADTFEAISKTLLAIRQDQQMTTVGGKRLE